MPAVASTDSANPASVPSQGSRSSSTRTAAARVGTPAGRPDAVRPTSATVPNDRRPDNAGLGAGEQDEAGHSRHPECGQTVPPDPDPLGQAEDGDENDRHVGAGHGVEVQKSAGPHVVANPVGHQTLVTHDECRNEPSRTLWKLGYRLAQSRTQRLRDGTGPARRTLWLRRVANPEQARDVAPAVRRSEPAAATTRCPGRRSAQRDRCQKQNRAFDPRRRRGRSPRRPAAGRRRRQTGADRCRPCARSDRW